jgi:thiamine-phosphate pyrophosphorylase
VSLDNTRPLIYLITSGNATDSNFPAGQAEILDVIRLSVAEGVDLIQIREKSLSARRLFELALAASALTRKTATRLLINDRADIAVAAGANGVHLAANSLSVKAVRKAFPGTLLIGVSTHSWEAAALAASEGADFAVFGPVYDTPEKGPAKGLEALQKVCERLSPFPVFGLGGVDLSRMDEVFRAGAAGIAGIRCFGQPNAVAKIMARSAEFSARHVPAQ